MFIRSLGLAGLLALPFCSHAALFIRDLDGDFNNGHEGVYDDVLNITWLADANLAASNKFGLPYVTAGNTNTAYGINSFGGMTWETTIGFTGEMNASAYLGYSNWRTPFIANTSPIFCEYSLDGTECGYNVQTYEGGVVLNELGFMYYENFGARGAYATSGFYLGLEQAGIDDAIDPNNYLHLFHNLDMEKPYWNGTDYDLGFHFSLKHGQQDATFTYPHYNVWAVHDGDIGTPISTVPIPAAAWLFGSGLLALTGMARKRAALIGNKH